MTNEELVFKIQRNEDREKCLESLYTQNKSMIASIANKYKAFIEFDDLMQEGFFGLCKACENYDSCKGVKFLTYAVYHIEQSMSRYADDNKSALRVPVYQSEKLRKYEKLVDDHIKKTGKEPTDRYLLLHLGITLEQLKQLKKDAQALKVSSLETPIQDDNGAVTLEATIKDPTNQFEQAEDKIQNEQLAKELWGIVDSLGPEQSSVIRERYKNNQTIEGTAAALGTTKGKITGIEQRAFRTLRSSKNRQRLKPYLPDDMAYSISVGYSSFGYFSKTWTSAPEKAVLLEERKYLRSM